MSSIPLIARQFMIAGTLLAVLGFGLDALSSPVYTPPSDVDAPANSQGAGSR